MTHTTWKKRAFAAVLSAAMLGTTMAASPIVWAADKTLTVNQTLEVAIPDENGEASNKDACTATILMSDLTDSGLTSLQFNFTAEETVTNFSYYFGINLDDDPWWTGMSKECEPNATEFSVVVKISDLDLKGCGIGYASEYDANRHLEMQNAYAANGSTKIPVTLTSVVVNGTTDTSDNPSTDPDPEEIEAKFPNTGDAGFYSSANTQSGNYEFTDNGDGTATVRATITKKIEADDLKAIAEERYGTDTITLTPSPEGKDYSEEGYATETNTPDEADIRKAGNPLNSHKFRYSDFGIGNDDTTTIIPEALTVVLRGSSDQNVTRVMYGGGLNVKGHTPADTEYAKTKIGRDANGNVTDSSLAGFKSDANSGYWYNDIGKDNYDAVAENLTAAGYTIGDTSGENGLVQIQNGKDLKDQNFGDYVQVTWDVPEDVKEYADASGEISFQLWYGEIEADEYTPLESLDIESAMLTYTEELTFPYQASKTVSVNETLNSSSSSSSTKATELLFSDFDMDYEVTADVYAVLFTLDSKVDAKQLVLGAGTSTLKEAEDYWYQGGSIALVKSDDTNHEYTYMWIMPTAVATVSETSHANFISTEKEGDHLSIGLYYADNADAKEVTSVTLKDVSVYYTTDDETNSAKADMFEDDLTTNPSEMTLEIGDTKNIVVNVKNCTYSSSDESVATVDANGKVTATGAGTATITVVTPMGQTKDVTVTVNAATTTTTTATTTATTTTTTTVTTTTDEQYVIRYGDVNCDDLVDLRDAIAMNRYLAGTLQLSKRALLNANCNQEDGTQNVDDKDGTSLMRYIVYLIKELPEK